MSERAAGARSGLIQTVWREFNKERQLWIISAVMLAWLALFAYYPMYGLIISFQNYNPGDPFFPTDPAKWVGLTHFKNFIASPDFPNVLRNTLVISGLNLLVGFPAPIILALLLNETRVKWFKKLVQTISYVPHFISWVVVASIVFSLLSTDGMINKLLMNLGLADKPTAFMNEGKYFWGVLVLANVWKSVGWSSIIYLSAMAGIDDELYQAGAVDGLGLFGMMRHITLPSIATTIVLLLILNIGSILSAGFEQQLLLGNDATRQYYEVIDTYAYKYGVQQGRYSYGAAVGMLKGVISVTLVFGTNYISKKKLDIAVL